MATDYNRAAGAADVIVFAATYEEAVWADGVDRSFTFLDVADIPTIDAFSIEFTTDLYYKVTITGSGITDPTTTTVDVYFGGIEQEVLSVAAGQIEVKLTSIDSGTMQNSFEVYFVEGVPNGLNSLDALAPTPFDTGIEFDPALIRLSTSGT